MEKKSKRIPVRNNKRFCAWLLSLVLCVGMLPSVALAADDQTDDMQKDTYAASVGSGEETTYYDTVKDAFTYANNLSTAATVTLFADCETSAALTIAEGTDITLDLSGHTISANGSVRVLNVYGSLTLTDSSSEEGGMITGGGGIAYGGGAYVYAGGSLTMKGGSIAGNSASYGGGVYVKGSFSMEGGSVSENTASGGGGGIYLYSKSTCSISGGAVSSNQASGSGGGIYVSRAALTMSGGEVTGNTSPGKSGLYYYYGGGIYLTGSYTFNLQGSPVIIGNLSGSSDNDVYLSDGKYITLSGDLEDGAQIGVKTEVSMTGEDELIQITDVENDTAYYLNGAKYFVSDDGYTVRTDKNGYLVLCITEDENTYVAGVMDHEGNMIRYQSIKSAVTYANSLDESTIILLADCASITSLSVNNGTSITLDLNGNVLTYTGSGATNFLHVNGTLILKDESVSGSGKVTAAGLNSYFGPVIVESGGEFYMESGSISENRVARGSSDDACGGVYVKDGGAFIMSGGMISNNSITRYGGGVYVEDGGAFTMNGGTITGNTCGLGGGGVYIASKATFNLSGSPVIIGNTNTKTDAPDNVYLSSGNTIVLSGNLIPGAEIGVTTAAALTDNAEVEITETETDTDYYKTAASYFFSDKGGYTWTGENGYIYMASYGVRLTNVQDAGYEAGVTAGAVGTELNHAMTGEYFYQWYRSNSSEYADARLIDGETDASYIPSTDTIGTYYCYCILTAEGEDGVQTQYLSNIVKIVVATEKAVSVDDGENLTYYSDVRDAFSYANSIDVPCTLTLLWDSQTDKTLTVDKGKNITLDLSGHTLSAATYISVLTVNGTLTLKDSSGTDAGKITGGKGTSIISGSFNSGSGGGVYVGTSGTFYMIGGSISGNRAYYEGGGVYVAKNGTFVMSGGRISENTADSSTSIEHAGGGVYVNSGTFTMNGGVIEGNTASTSGGGVYVYTDSTFIMSGGEITDNTADTYGGGIYVYSGTCTMSGGQVADNTAESYGGGIYIGGGIFTLNDGTISRNKASVSGGGVYVGGGTFNINGGTITENTAATSGGGVYAGGTIVMEGAPFLVGNTVDGFSNNLYLPTGMTIALGTALGVGANVGITTQKDPTEDEDIVVTASSLKYAPSSVKYFFSDAGYDVRTKGTGYVVLWLDTSPKDAKTPAFTVQPQNASYIVGDEAVALEVEANVSDGGTLTYQWYICYSDSDTDGEAIDGANRESYTPSTDTEGTFYYYCMVTNTNDNVDGQQQVSAVSEIAVITVTAASGGGDDVTGGDEKIGGDSGFALSGGDWYYFAEGSISTAGYKDSGIDVVKGTIDGSSGWYYVKNGRYVSDYTGFATNENGSWYIENGKVTFKQNSVIKDTTGALSKGTWYYVVGSKVQTSYTGVANYKNANGWWYIKNGKVDFTANTVAKNKNGWWYVVGGKVQLTYTGVANYKNASGWWYIKNGKVDFTANTVAKNKNGWWYVVGGKVQLTYTGVANYKNASGWWYIRSGKVDFTYTGKASNKYGTWKVVKGKVVF